MVCAVLKFEKIQINIKRTDMPCCSNLKINVDSNHCSTIMIHTNHYVDGFR